MGNFYVSIGLVLGAAAFWIAWATWFEKREIRRERLEQQEHQA